MANNNWSSPTPSKVGEVISNISFKENLNLDLYKPTKKKFEKSPVLVFIHGGAWLGGYKESINNDRFNDTYHTLRAKGYTIVSPNYTLAKYGKSPFPMAIEDIYDALNWIANHADKYQLDKKNIGILGESAGGQLSLLVVYGDAAKYHKKLDIVPTYFVDVYSPTDLKALYEVQKPRMDTIKSYTSFLPNSWQQKTDINQYLFGFDPETSPDEFNRFIETYSPLANTTHVKPPLMVIHGDKDQVVPIEQSKKYVRALRKKGNKVDFLLLPGVNHGLRGINRTQHQKIQQRIIDFVVSNYQIH